MVKNITPYKLSLTAAAVIGILVFCLASLGTLLNFVNVQWYHIAALGFVTFIASYFIISFILKKYIYRKIKLIYKNIRSSKRSFTEGASINMNEDIISDVEQDVADWAISRDNEIESLKSMEAYRRNFMGDISHELKTPIFSIQGYLHTLLDGALFDKDVNEDYIRKAAKNVERLQTIVEDLEAISRLESGEFILDIIDFDLKILCQEVFDELEIIAKKENISLIYKEGAADPFRIKGDRENIRQVLINLINNSIKYGNQGGHTKVSFYDMDKVILVEISDNGIGIDDDHLRHLFDRFYRVDKSRSRIQGGSGLGLSIVKHIIEAHEQTINVRSTKGVGSTFGFTLAKAT